jgi:hypothetical protein
MCFLYSSAKVIKSLWIYLDVIIFVIILCNNFWMLSLLNISAIMSDYFLKSFLMLPFFNAINYL